MEQIIWTGTALLILFITVEIARYMISRHKADEIILDLNEERRKAMNLHPPWMLSELARLSEKDPVRREMQAAMGYEPTNRETILYRALSRFYGEYSDMESEPIHGENPRKDGVTDEAYHALAIASHDWRNALTQHTWVVEDERAEDNPQRIDWECPDLVDEHWSSRER